jgi:hypothetical protein
MIPRWQRNEKCQKPRWMGFCVAFEEKQCLGLPACGVPLEAGRPVRQAYRWSLVWRAWRLQTAFTTCSGGQDASAIRRGRRAPQAVCETKPIFRTKRICRSGVISITNLGHRSILLGPFPGATGGLLPASGIALLPVADRESPAPVRSDHGMHWRSSRKWHPERRSKPRAVCETKPILQMKRRCRFEVMAISNLGHRTIPCRLGASATARSSVDGMRRLRLIHRHHGMHWRTSRQWPPERRSETRAVCETKPILGT